MQLSASRCLFFSIFCFIMLFAGAQEEREWEEIEDMPSNRHHPVTFTIDSFGYAATGWNSFVGPTDDFYRYDPKKDEWETLPDFPGAIRSFGIGFSYKGKGYLGFGANLTTYLNDIWEYDAATESWVFVTSCPCSGRRHPALLILDNMLYVGLGDDATGDLRDWWRYDMVEDDWDQMDNLPALARHHPFQFVADSQLFVGFGHGGPIIYRDWYTFDTEDEEWVTLDDFMDEARVAGTQFSHDSFGYVLSGDGSDHSFMQEGEFWQYNPRDDDWTEMPPHPGISIWAPGSFVIEDTIYLFGGENRQTGNIQDEGWKFQLKDTPPPPLGNTEPPSEYLRLYPNPVGSELWIDASFGIVSIEVFDLSGNKVMHEMGNTKSLQVSNLDAGAYIAVVSKEGGERHIAKFIKA